MSARKKKGKLKDFGGLDKLISRFSFNRLWFTQESMGTNLDGQVNESGGGND